MANISLLLLLESQGKLRSRNRFSRLSRRASLGWENKIILENLLKRTVVYRCGEYRHLQPPELDLDQLLRSRGPRSSGQTILFLVRSGANPNIELESNWSEGMTAMICTILDNRSTVECVELLLHHHADANQLVKRGTYGTSLIAACARGRDDIVQLLLRQKGIDIGLTSSVGSVRTALIAACASDSQRANDAQQEKCVHLLLSHQAPVNKLVSHESYPTALIAACDSGYARIVQMLLQHDAHVNLHASEGSAPTALTAACAGGYTDIVEMLLEHKADVNLHAPGEGALTALVVASNGGNSNIVRMLLGNDANINLRAPRKAALTALMAASSGGHSDTVRMLLENGADVNPRAPWEAALTALKAVSSGGHPSVAQTPSNDKRHESLREPKSATLTALIAACDGGHTDIVWMLLGHGAAASLADPVGVTCDALISACGHGHHRIAKLLLTESEKTGHRADATALSEAIVAAATAESPRTVSLLLNALPTANGHIASDMLPPIESFVPRDCFDREVGVPVRREAVGEETECKLAARQVANAVIYTLLSSEKRWAKDYIRKALKCLRYLSSDGINNRRASNELLKKLGFDASDDMNRYHDRLYRILRDIKMDSIQKGETWNEVVDEIATLVQQVDLGVLPTTSLFNEGIDDFDWNYDDSSFSDEDEDSIQEIQED